MTEMGINRRNRQIINKNANEMAKGPFEKVAILAKMACTDSVSFHQPHIKKNIVCMLASFLKLVLAEMAISR